MTGKRFTVVQDGYTSPPAIVDKKNKKYYIFRYMGADIVSLCNLLNDVIK